MERVKEETVQRDVSSSPPHPSCSGEESRVGWIVAIELWTCVTQLRFLQLMILYRKRIRAEALVMCHRAMQQHPPPHTPTPAVYSSVLRGCCWSEDDLVEGGCEEIWWWWGIGGGGGVWLQFKTLMLIDHSQSMASQRCEDTHINRDAWETDRSLKVWQRAISCQSLSLKAPRLLISQRVHTYIPGERQPEPELYIFHITGGGKTFLLVCFLTEGMKNCWVLPKETNRQAQISNDCLLVWKHLLNFPPLTKYQLQRVREKRKEKKS